MGGPESPTIWPTSMFLPGRFGTRVHGRLVRLEVAFRAGFASAASPRTCT